MTDVVPIRRSRAGKNDWSERVAELRARLASELQDLADQQTQRMAEQLRRAGGGRAHGAGKNVAEEEDGGVAGRRIRLLGQLIAGLANADPESLRADRAGYGSTVCVRDLRSGGEAFYTLVSGGLIDVDANQVSLASPLGQALLGCRVGDEPVVETPQGARRLRVIAVHTLAQSVGLMETVPPGAA